ncbi:MAG: transporter [Glaciihabitans sp.]|nr:transporter [Glaciihabitans sp.]
MTISATAATSGASALSVTLSGVGRSFAGPQPGAARRQVLRNIDLTIGAGEIVALLGPSGCGKSTLLRQISGLDTPSVGTITIAGRPLNGIDQRCSVAFQEPRLLPWRSIARNIELGLPRGISRVDGRARVAELLELVQLSDAADLRPRQVSGGMAQRASLARALARGPGVLVLDEPFGALDALTRLTMQDLLLDIHAVEPATIVLVTHDVDEALYLADRVVLLGDETGVGPGRGAVIRSIVDVPGRQPRDRADPGLASLSVHLLEGLGVHTHHAPTR